MSSLMLSIGESEILKVKQLQGVAPDCVKCGEPIYNGAPYIIIRDRLHDGYYNSLALHEHCVKPWLHFLVETLKEWRVIE